MSLTSCKFALYIPFNVYEQTKFHENILKWKCGKWYTWTIFVKKHARIIWTKEKL